MSPLLRDTNFEKALEANTNFECHSYEKILMLKAAIRLILKDTNFECYSYVKILMLKAAIRPILKDTNFECYSYEKILILKALEANTKRY